MTQHLAGGGAVPTNKQTLGQFADQWLQDYAKSRVRPTTFRAYEDILKLHIGPALGHFKIARLSPQAVQGYYTRKLTEDRPSKKGAKKKPLSSTTLLHHHRLLDKILDTTLRWGMIVRNPADLVDPPSRAEVELKVWDEEQVRMFLGTAKRISRYYGLYLAAATTGMRAGGVPSSF